MKRRSTSMSMLIAAVLVAVLILEVKAQIPPASPRPERGVGPFQMQSKRGALVVRLLRREKDIVWMDQQISSGKYIETGLGVKEIERFDIPRPRVFDTVDQATATDQIAQVQMALKKISDSLKPFRDLPGIPADEALYLQGKLLEKGGRWREALAIYEDIAKQPYGSTQAPLANLRAGLCYAQLQQADKALAYLDNATIPDDDLATLSDIYFARAQARAAANRHKEAIMDYLYLVVFAPYVKNNEVRCLSAALPSYAVLQDWDAASKTLGVLRAQYPDAAETKVAIATMEKYQTELGKESTFAVPQ